ncbi:hypothetical protein [Candidatus Liberibacter solanacearum]|uniref:Uncharacterized protein n=2 Tax=Candidatus Liberibacter solanacearum TaxID=556287 RepID=A0A1V2N7K1_9HYPH|nr:hypothetical protein [Candidatus Liberibacter solanacearum]ONI58875.1 hypothetical protein AYO25_03950 [Candidatus Liberibacter solanacearum]ONI59594.1 hypothetical protein AYJ09_03390 [Candidatus Liberibacter solanacearum]
MQVSSINGNTNYFQNMDSNLTKIVPNNYSSESFSSFLQTNDLQKTSDQSKYIPEAMQKLQGVMFQYFIKSILPEETIKSLGGGFYGDFWKEILAENISNVIVKQQRITFNLSNTSKQNVDLVHSDLKYLK